jgi:hypothetical protein
MTNFVQEMPFPARRASRAGPMQVSGTAPNPHEEQP